MKTHEQFIAERMTGIGGTDISCLFDKNPYKTAYDVFFEKTGQLVPEDISNQEKIRFGNYNEAYIVMRFEEETKLKVTKPEDTKKHPDYPFMIGNLDGEGVDSEGKRFVLECKTTGEYNADEWAGDKIPDYYRLQVLHYLVVTGYDYGYIAYMISNRKFDFKRVDISDRESQIIIDKCKEFWGYVESKQFPLPNPELESASSILDIMFPVSLDDEILDCTNNSLLNDDILALKDIKAKIKALEKEKEVYENKLKLVIQDHSGLRCADGSVSYKSVTSTKFDTTAFKENEPKVYEELFARFKTSTTSRRFLIK